jgi:carbamoyl-phosphate synthase small subunit
VSRSAYAAVDHARRFPGLAGMDLAKIVTTRDNYQWSLGPHLAGPGTDPLPKRSSAFEVVAYDFGIKRSILPSAGR